LAGRPNATGVEELAAIWQSISRQDVFPVHPLAGLLGFLGQRNHLVPPGGLERLVRRHLPYARIEDAKIPLHLVATEVTTGREVLVSRGEAVRAILASAALPGVFPPVFIGSHELIDGGVVNNTPISHAVHLGATVVYVMPTGYACELSATPRSALGMVLHALTLLIVRQLMDDIERFETVVELHVIPPLCPLSVSPADFGHSHGLTERAYAASAEWLKADPPTQRQRDLLDFHHHAV